MLHLLLPLERAENVGRYVYMIKDEPFEHTHYDRNKKELVKPENGEIIAHHKTVLRLLLRDDERLW